jgi:hypothetical protein
VETRLLYAGNGSELNPFMSPMIKSVKRR